MRALFFAVVTILLTGMAARAVDIPVFAVGQKWTIKDSSVTIVIGRIETFGKGMTAISISVFDVPCPVSAGCVTTVVGHAPFEGAVLATSVDKLIATDAVTAPAFESGYANWKKANGGVFTIPVRQLPDLLFKAVGSAPLQSE